MMDKKEIVIAPEELQRLNNRIYTVEQKNKKLLEIIKRYNIDISHIEE